MLELLLEGVAVLLQPEPLLYLGLGVVVGFAVGVLPGFESGNAAALALPLSMGLAPESALIFMASIYVSSQFAGAVPAILLNVPGTPGAAATAMDGYPMTQQGRAGEAIGIARMSSAVGGMIGCAMVIAVIGPLATLALRFQSPEVFLVTMIGLTVIGTVVGDAPRKGILAALLGLLIASMAASPQTAEPRLTFGFLELYDEIPFIPVIIGLFAFTEMFLLAGRRSIIDPATDVGALRSLGGVGILRDALIGMKRSLKHPLVMVRSSLIGLGIGIIPGMGVTISNFVAWGDAKRRSREPDRFGKGAEEGIIASESCDNAVTSATMVPTLTLGIPGGGTAAIMLAALYLHGIQPGPRLMQTHGPEAYAVLLAMFVASLLILPVGTLLAAPMAQVIRVPPRFLVPAVLTIAVIGSYAMRTSMFDVGLALVFGVLGVAMRLAGYPVIPLVLGLILGPIIERNFLRSLALEHGNPLVFFRSGTSLVLWALLALIVLLTVRRSRSLGRNSGHSA
ncbi:MAG: hypothetical protein EA417_08670 [Gammaproteobacteria bacterium]|nr:MAG: hypothetical protein EA417_08670 [Gammaproteobacteria bacterium]